MANDGRRDGKQDGTPGGVRLDSRDWESIGRFPCFRTVSSSEQEQIARWSDERSEQTARQMECPVPPRDSPLYGFSLEQRDWQDEQAVRDASWRVDRPLSP